MSTKYLLAVLTTSAVLLTTYSLGQAQDIKVGGGLVYGSEIENLGLQVNAYYNLPANDQIFIGGDFTYFFPDTENGFRFNWTELNFNGHYIFYADDFSAYALAGLNVAFLKVSFDTGDPFLDDFSDTTTEIGLNLGGGIEYALDFGSLYAELKFVVSDADQLVLGGGLRIPLRLGN